MAARLHPRPTAGVRHAIDQTAFYKNFEEAFNGEESGEFWFTSIKFYWLILSDDAGRFGRVWFFVTKDELDEVQTKLGGDFE